MRLRISATAGLKRSTCPTQAKTPALLNAACTFLAASTEAATGFSIMVATPAPASATATSSW